MSSFFLPFSLATTPSFFFLFLFLASPPLLNRPSRPSRPSRLVGRAHETDGWSWRHGETLEGAR
ncbi:hypothetical protein SODALDRAFT_334162 [Sodiomyces alkalinus F11]|uniref:Uncharacterized protein n=1 Tax=Sodiomyces alkalinus (strain CBS 110278 / VKM F-3762 / F11) TaxID=1314773 RepID=A0A3N2PRE6_SODAK|nr:hypothetical protein SODALDRAFT_334162 [Sodiomyces alkalinus F11]ROT37092.1 hypothetical protein SODALDRAFT_334162 [Sodiomyces alkalinus F11]